MSIGQLDVFGITNNGKLWHTTRVMAKSEDSWTPWEDVKATEAGDPGPFISVDSAQSFEALVVCGVTNDGKLWYSFFEPLEWAPFVDVKALISGDWGVFQNVGIATLNDGLHVCVTALTAPGQWRILHTIRHADGTWDSFEDVNALTAFPGSFISIDCANIKGELHVCGVSDNGKLWHTVRSSQNNWLPFEDVQATASNAPDSFASVSITEGDGDLHVCAQAGGDVWHTIRFSADPPSWQPAFDSVKGEAGDPGSFGPVSCGSFPEELHICSVTGEGRLWHTIQFSSPLDWLPFEDVGVLVGNPDPGLFIFVSLLGFVAPPPPFDPVTGPNCTDGQNQIYSDCYRIHHTRKASVKNALQQDIASIQANQPDCSFDIPQGCGS